MYYTYVLLFKIDARSAAEEKIFSVLEVVFVITLRKKITSAKNAVYYVIVLIVNVYSFLCS